MDKNKVRVVRIFALAAVLFILINIPLMSMIIATVTIILIPFALFIGPFHIYFKHRKSGNK